MKALPFTKHVLVVDDNSTLRRAICKVLQAHGFDCHQATDGVTALQELRKTDFDLVLTDYQMPEMNGLEFLKNLATLVDLPHPPVRIMMTGTRDETIYQQALNAGALLVLLKTGDFHCLVDQVMEVLESDIDTPGCSP